METETLEQFQWVLRDTALWAVDAHSPAGGLPAVERALEELGILGMEVGAGVTMRNRYDLRKLPNGTILTLGEIGNIHYRVYVWKDGLQQLLGPLRATGNRPFLIFEGPDLARPAWLDVQPGPNETGRIESWKKEASRVGYRAKERNSWCPTYERVMESMGIYS